MGVHEQGQRRNGGGGARARGWRALRWAYKAGILDDEGVADDASEHLAHRSEELLCAEEGELGTAGDETEREPAGALRV